MVVWMAQPIAESRIVIANPPCTTPIGLKRDSPASPTNVTLPSSAVPPVKPIVAVIGGAGSLPSKIARMNSRPLNPAPRVSASIGSSHVIVRVRAFVSTSIMESHRLLELDRSSLNRRRAETPDGGGGDGAGEREAGRYLPAAPERTQDLSSTRGAENGDENRHAEGDAELARHAVDRAAGGESRGRQRRRHCAREGRDHETHSGAPEQHPRQDLGRVVRLEPDMREPPDTAACEQQSADGRDHMLPIAARQDASWNSERRSHDRPGRDLEPGGDDVFVPDAGQEEDVRKEHRAKGGEEKCARDVCRAEGARTKQTELEHGRSVAQRSIKKGSRQ